ISSSPRSSSGRSLPWAASSTASSRRTSSAPSSKNSNSDRSQAVTLSRRAQLVQPSPTLAITARAKAMQAAGKDVVSLSAGEPDFGTPEHVRKAGIEASESGFTRYTATAGTPELRKAIAEKHRREN